MEQVNLDKMKRSFFVRNLIKVLLPILIPTFILGALLILLIQIYIKDSIEEQNENLLKLLQSNVEIILNEMNSINLHIVASAVEFVDLQRILQKDLLDLTLEDYIQLAALKRFIDSPSIAQPHVESIYIYIDNDKQRFITSTTGGIVDISEFDDVAWITSYYDHKNEKEMWMENRTFKREYSRSSTSNVEVISMFRTITLDNGEEGVVILNLNSDFLNNELKKLSQANEQNFLIVDDNGQLLFKKNDMQLTPNYIEQMLLNEATLTTMDIHDEKTVIFKQPSTKYNLTIITTFPNRLLYKIPFKLIRLTLILMGISIIISGIVAYYLTKRNYRNLHSIINVLQHAEQGKELPHLPDEVNNLYSVIVYKILINFMEQSYLKIKLSEKKYKSQAMDLKALQGQVNPHFLFNTLETINWKIFSLTKEPSELTNMVENLANILRYSLRANHAMEPLEREIQYTKNYIEIQKVRYKDQFKVIWDYDESCEKYLVEKLIIQPLVENSFLHGMENPEKQYLIKVKIRVKNNLLTIKVIDNGKGISREKLSELRQWLSPNCQQEVNHIGLLNTHRRIQLVYGMEYGVYIVSKAGWGTSVTMTIPT